MPIRCDVPSPDGLRAIVGPAALTVVGSTLMSVAGNGGAILFYFCALIAMAWLLIQLFTIASALFTQDLMRLARRMLGWTVAGAASFLGLFAGDYVHTLMFYPLYKEQVSHQAAPIRFDWPAIDPVYRRILIYDPTGQTALAAGHGPSAQDDNNLTSVTRRLIGNWFLEEWSDSWNTGSQA